MYLSSTFVRSFFGGFLLAVIFIQPAYANLSSHIQPEVTKPEITKPEVTKTEYVRTNDIYHNKTTDIEYAKVDGISLKLDIYLPEDTTGPAPTRGVIGCMAEHGVQATRPQLGWLPIC